MKKVIEATYRDAQCAKYVEENLGTTTFGTFGKEFKNGQWYTIRIIEEDETPSCENNFTGKVKFLVDLNECQTEHVTIMTYDEVQLHNIQCQNKFWKRLRLGLRYIFKRR